MRLRLRIPLLGDPRRVVLVQNRIEDRLLRQARRPCSPAGSLDERKLLRPGRSPQRHDRFLRHHPIVARLKSGSDRYRDEQEIHPECAMVGPDKYRYVPSGSVGSRRGLSHIPEDTALAGERTNPRPA